jgi:transposase-like protein
MRRELSRSRCLVDGRARDRDGTLRAGHRASCGSAAWCDVDTVRTGVIGLASRGLTTGEISAHFAEACGASVSRDTITCDRAAWCWTGMATWWSRPLERGRFPTIEAN